MAEFDKSLNCTQFCVILYHVRGELCVLCYICTSFSVLHLIVVLFCVLQIFGPFYPKVNHNSVYFDSPRDSPKSLCTWEEERIEECRAGGHHSWSIVVPMVCCVLISPKAVCFHATVELPRSFIIIISRGYLTFRRFSYKKVVCNLISTSIPFSSVSIPPSS